MTERAKDGLSFFLAAAFVLPSFGCRSLPGFDSRERAELAATVTADWTELSQLAAAKTIALYGPPDALAEDGLGWTRRGPWKRIVILNADDGYVAREGTAASLSHTIAYRLPEEKRAAVAKFGRGVRVSVEGDELSARSLDERYNLLALNLADEIVRGVKSPDQARLFFDRTVELDAAGKTSFYMQKLLFQPQE